jgi:hypothetical protein
VSPVPAPGKGLRRVTLTTIHPNAKLATEHRSSILLCDPFLP